MRSRGYRVTPQREAIYEVLQRNEGKPLCPEDIYKLAGERYPRLGLTTVYRTMELFCELGLAQHVHLHEDAQYYEIYTGKHHHHLVCNSCGSVRILEACMIEDLKELVRDDCDFVVTSHCMSLFGYCRRCLGDGKV